MAESLACSHDSGPFGPPICAHLRSSDGSRVHFYQWFHGRDLAVELLCAECFAARKRGGTDVPVAPVCEKCFKLAIHERGYFQGSSGRMEFRDRPLPFDARVFSIPLPAGWGEILDAAPIDASRSLWILLSGDGHLIRFDADSAAATWLAQCGVPRECGQERQRVHVSPRGDAAAVVNDWGRFGEILDLRRGMVTLQLDGRDHHARTVPFAIEFFEARDGRTLAVHRTDGNRLDLSDPFTGELLTERGPTTIVNGVRPERYLDYFHGGLAVSPGSRLLLDDGWEWQPMGYPRVLSLDAWLGNVWESEDGPSCRYLYGKENWNSGLAWIDSDRLAISGFDEYELVPGVRLFDLRIPAADLDYWSCSIGLPGPTGELFSDGESLFSTGPGGLSRWDLADGCRTGHLPGFEPSRHHRGAGELVQLSGGHLLRWKISSGLRGNG